MRFLRILVICIILTSGALSARAATPKNVGFIRSNIWYSQEPFFEDDTIRIYSAIFNGETGDLKGTAIFYDNNTTIGSTEFSAVGKGGMQIVWADWKATRGNHKISATIKNATISMPGKNPEPIQLEQNQTSVLDTVVDQDTDRDRVGNAQDLDDDNDDLSDKKEIEIKTDPLVADTDKDGITDGKDSAPLVKEQKSTDSQTSSNQPTSSKQQNALTPSVTSSTVTNTINSVSNAITKEAPLVKNIAAQALNAINNVAANTSHALEPKKQELERLIKQTEKENNYNKTASIFQTPLNYLYDLILSATLYILEHKFLLYPIIAFIVYKILKFCWKHIHRR